MQMLIPLHIGACRLQEGERGDICKGPTRLAAITGSKVML